MTFPFSDLRTCGLEKQAQHGIAEIIGLTKERERLTTRLDQEQRARLGRIAYRNLSTSDPDAATPQEKPE